MNDVLAPAGPQAAHIAALWWLMLWVSVFVFAAMMVVLAWALWRGPRSRADTPPDVAPAASGERSLGWSVRIGLGVASALLLVLLVASLMTDRALATLSMQDALRVRVTSHQFWWEVVYQDPQPQRTFATANELYLPVGTPVEITLQADDVIHSFWVPSLHGKKDLIPGRTSTIRLRADREGRFTGRCAEYCGLEHAFMELDVVALSPERFTAWADARRAPAREPADAEARRGLALFVTGSCMLCHTVVGTTAQGRKAPDLTHFASRAHIAAGRLVNSPAALAAWIADPQSIKPGVNMPTHWLPPADLAALVAYLGTLR